MSTRERSQTDVWSYRQGTLVGDDIGTAGIVDYKVEAQDGSIGKVDEASFDEGASRLIVDTGGWIFGKKVMLPAGVVQRVDRDEEKVFVSLTKEQIKNAPEYEDHYRDDPTYLTGLGSYYGPGGLGYQDWEEQR